MSSVLEVYPDQQTLTFKEKIHEYANVYSFVFEKERNITYTAGMYAHMRVLDLLKGENVRKFSIVTAPSEGGDLRFAVHVREGSYFKQKLGNLEAGSTVTIFKINGDFVLPEDESKDVVLIAGGIGITPIRSMIVESQMSGRKKQPILLHSSEGGYLFQDELAKYDNEKYYTRKDTFDAELTSLIEAHKDAIFYVSGPPAFVDATNEKLKEQGIEEGMVKNDYFENYDPDD